MGRRKIQEEQEEIDFRDTIYPHGTLTCPVCGEEFEADDNTRYIVKGGYTCSLKCFLTRVKECESKKQI